MRAILKSDFLWQFLGGFALGAIGLAGLHIAESSAAPTEATAPAPAHCNRLGRGSPDRGRMSAARGRGAMLRAAGDRSCTALPRPEERRVGQECVSTGRARWLAA